MDDVRFASRRQTRPQTAPSNPADPGRARGRPQLRQPRSTSYGVRNAKPSPLSMLEESSRAHNGNGVTSKLMNSVRRSLSYGAAGKKRESGMAAVGMYSTPEESLTPSTSRIDFFDGPLTSPTIEQIAMGLHVSRTPHLGSQKAYSSRPRYRDAAGTPSQSVSSSLHPSRPTHRRRDSAPSAVIQLLPPPERSSLKKPTTPLMSPSLRSLSTPLTPSASNTSLSTLTSTTAPSTPRSLKSDSLRPASFASRLQFSMSKLLPRKNSQSVTTLSTNSSEDPASPELTPRKVVRFSSLTGPENEDS